MIKAHRLSTTGALIVCLVGQWTAPLIASEEAASATAVRSSELVANSSSELQNPTSATLAAVASVNLQPDDATAMSSVPPSTMERVRLALKREVPAANVPAGETSVQMWRSAFTFVPNESGSFAQRGRGRYRGRRGGDRNEAATAAIVLGAIGTIAGAAVLVYANRPECRTNQLASGCGYGTKVAGVAVLSAGAVGLVVGSLTWR